MWNNWRNIALAAAVLVVAYLPINSVVLSERENRALRRLNGRFAIERNRASIPPYVTYILPWLRSEGHVTAVAAPEITESEARALDDLPWLQALRLGPGRVIANGSLRNLCSVQSATRLWLYWTDVEDDDLAEVAAITGLEELAIDGCGITDAGMHHLLALRRLRTVRLVETRVTYGCLPMLCGLPSLRTVTLENNPEARGDATQHLRNARGEPIEVLLEYHERATRRRL